MGTESQILVVDDEPGMRDMIELELVQRGHHVVKAGDATEALLALENADFDVVITDVRMPGGDGISVLKRVKATSPDTEVMIITAYTELESAIECLRSGAFDLIRKPFHLTDFLNAVDRALDHRRLHVTSVLNEACQELFSNPDGVPLSERIARTAMRLVGADDASVMLLDSSGSLRIAFATGISEAIQAKTRLALGERIAGRVALDRAPAVLANALSDDARFSGVVTDARVRSAIVYPLVHQDTVVGVLNLSRIESPHRFRKADLESTGIVAAQAALALRNERLTQQLVASERLTAIGELAAGVVHEINNPLTYILSNAAFARETLASQPRDARGWRVLSPEAEEDVDALLSEMEDGARQLTAIAADMRGLSREDENICDRFDVNVAVRSAIRIAGPTLRRSADVETTLQDGLNVVGNPGRLGQVFLNLLVNAAHALDAVERREARITVTSRRVATRVIVEVADNGPGIPAGHLFRIMEPFYSTKPTGSGLGLSISRDIVEGHGGELRGSSRPEGGAIFSVSLPAAPAEKSSTPPASQQPAEPRHPRVLFVDDDEVTRRAASRFFSGWSELQVAEDGEQALTILEGEPRLDVIVTDVVMPRLTGIDLFREIRKRWPWMVPRILFVTGGGLASADAELIRSAGVRLLPKPIDFLRLREEVERVMEVAAQLSARARPGDE